MFFTKRQVGFVILLVLFALTASISAEPVNPWGKENNTLPVAGSFERSKGAVKSNGIPASSGSALVEVAEYLKGMQADITDDNAGNGTNGVDETPDDPDDGGWDWVIASPPAPFAHSTANSPTNIYGATAMGLLSAYKATGDASYFTALTDAADYMAGNTSIWSAADIIFLMQYNDLSVVTGTMYADAAKAKFDARIASKGSATLLAEYIRDVRNGQGYSNGIIAWDVGAFARSAAMLSARYPTDPYDYAQASIDIAEVLWQDSYNSNPGYFDIVADAGFDPAYGVADYWMYNLGIAGLIDAFSESGAHTVEIPGLVTLLLQSLHPSGAMGYCNGVNIDDEDWQSTAYAMMTLGRLDQATYQTEINRMSYWLSMTQDLSGGWLYAGSGNHYPEVAGECARGIYYATGDLSNIIVDDGFTSQADVDIYNSANGTSYAWGYDAFATIQEGINAVLDNGTVYVLNGNYAEALTVSKNLTLTGESEAGVIIDASSFSAYGINSSATNVNFNNFTMIGPLPAAFGYGLKIAGDLTNCTIANVTVQNCGRSGIDINGADLGSLLNVTVTGNGGVGLGITDGRNITIENITTSGNAWGGIGIYTQGTYYTGGTDNIVLTGTNSFGEITGLYTEEGGGFPITNLTIPTSDFSHLTGSNSVAGLHAYYPDLATAQAVVLGGPDPLNSFIIDRTTNELMVSVGMTIQASIVAAVDGQTINVDAGTYEEQLDISKEISIVGAGIGATTIQSPTTLPLFFTTSANNYPIVYVHDAVNPSISNLTIDGMGRGNANYRFVGVGYWNTGGTISNVHITTVRDEPFSGNQHGVSIYAYNNTSGPYTIDVTNVTIDDMQKTGISLSGDGLTANVTGCTVTGQGPTAITAQNGIQISFGATGTVDNCSVSGIVYTGPSWTASGMLFYLANSVDLIGNSSVTNSQSSIVYQGTNGTIDGVSVVAMGAEYEEGVSIRDYGYSKSQITDLAFRNVQPFEEAYNQSTPLKGMATSVSMDNLTLTGIQYVNSYGVAVWSVGDNITATITNSTITDWEIGVVAYESGSVADIIATSNTITNNTEGAWSNTVTPISMSNNYWGSYCGPLHAVTNPNGMGNQVSDGIVYEPWCNADFTKCDFTTSAPAEIWVDDDYTELGANDGHYWCYDAFDNIQSAVDAIADGGTINVASGAYVEQIKIETKSLDLIGAGSATTIVQAVPVVDRVSYSVTQWSGSARTIDACIGVADAGVVNISGLTVDGLESGPNNFYGIHYFNTDGSVNNCQISNITDAVNLSYSRIVSLVATHGVGETFSIDFSDNVIPNFQKGGILIMGPGATFTVNNNSVSGVVSSSLAGNCIQLSYGASGSTSGNYVEGTAYTGSDWASTGILLFESGDVSMDGDEAYNCESGINYSDWGWVYNKPTPVNLSFTNLNLHDNTWTLGVQMSRDSSSVNMTVTDCNILNNGGDGIDIFGTALDPWGGSYYTGWNNGNLNAVITGCTITGSLYDGIWTADQSGNTTNTVSVEIHGCYFTGNTASAVNNTFTDTISATGCYWDDPSGPTVGVKSSAPKSITMAPSPYGDDMPENAPVVVTNTTTDKGTGETVLGAVDYSPWWNANYVGDPHTSSWTWNLDNSYNSLIQEAVDAASSGDIINVLAGTYVGQTYINKSLDIIGAGMDNSIIEAVPLVDRTTYDITQWSGSVRTIDACIGVFEAGTVHISGFTIDGKELGPNNFYGVHFFDSDGSVTDCRIVDITNAAGPSNSRVASLVATHSASGSFNVDFSNNLIPSFQKGGILLMGPSGTCTVDNNNVDGGGITTLAQNGIQVSYGTSGTLTGNDVSGVAYPGTDWSGTGILFFESGDITVTGGTVVGCEMGINYSQWNWVYTPTVTPTIIVDGVTLDNNQWAIETHLGNDGVSLNVEVLNCTITNSTSAGVELWGSDADPWGGAYYAGWTNGTLNANIHDNVITDGSIGIEQWLDLTTGNVTNSEAHKNSFAGSTSYGVYNNFSTLFNAEENWWGDISGPFLDLSKSSGTTTKKLYLPFMANDDFTPESFEYTRPNLADKGFGVSVSANVDYEPWCNEDFSVCGFGTPNVVWIDDDYTPADANDGHIWGYDAFTSIQDGIDVINTGGTIYIFEGIYTEQVHINKDNLTFIGAGVDVSVITSPATLTHFFTATSNNDYPVVFVDSISNVTMSGLTIDGDHQGDSNYRFAGLGIWNSSGSFTDLKIINIMNSTFSGAQHGVGVLANNNTGGPYTITLNGLLVEQFQKTAVALIGDGLVVDVSNVTTIGAGATSVTAQNGIQISGGAGGTVDNCSISKVTYTGGTWTATGFLVFGPGTVNANAVTIDECQTSVYYIDGGGTFDNSTVTNPTGDGLWVYSTGTAKASNTRLKLPEAFETEIDYRADKAPISITISNSTFTGVDLADSWGVSAYAVGPIDFNVTNCEVSHWAYGIVPESGGSIVTSVISGNEVSFTLQPGIDIRSENAQVLNNILYDCNYYGPDGWGGFNAAAIQIAPGSDNALVDGNTVSDCVNGIQTWANNTTISNNELFDMGDSYQGKRYIDCPGPNCRTYYNSAILVGSHFGGTAVDYDPVGTVIEQNSIHDNHWGLFYDSNLTVGVDARNNFWGVWDGPTDTIGTAEATVTVCHDVADVTNEIAETYPASGLGDGVSENVIYCPWGLYAWNCCVIRGDINHSGYQFGLAVNVSDLTALVAYLFQGAPPPYCLEEANVDNIGAVNVADLTYLVDYLFKGGPAPSPCN